MSEFTRVGLIDSFLNAKQKMVGAELIRLWLPERKKNRNAEQIDAKKNKKQKIEKVPYERVQVYFVKLICDRGGAMITPLPP